MTRRTTAADAGEQPLISQRFLARLALTTVALVALTSAIGFGGHWLGQRMALGGHTESDEVFDVAIGEDLLHLSANTIRFENQRRPGAAERVDLYLTWPGMTGYSKSLSASFDSVERPDLLIFLQISQGTMSKDMSGRVTPIYRQLFDGAGRPFPHGLTLHAMRPDSGYGREVMLTAERSEGDPYAVRCLLPQAETRPTSGDCQRDIHVGSDLTVLYRFSSVLLKDWDHIDAAVRSFVETRLAKAEGASGAEDD